MYQNWYIARLYVCNGLFWWQLTLTIEIAKEKKQWKTIGTNELQCLNFFYRRKLSFNRSRIHSQNTVKKKLGPLSRSFKACDNEIHFCSFHLFTLPSNLEQLLFYISLKRNLSIIEILLLLPPTYTFFWPIYTLYNLSFIGDKGMNLSDMMNRSEGGERRDVQLLRSSHQVPNEHANGFRRQAAFSPTLTNNAGQLHHFQASDAASYTTPQEQRDGVSWQILTIVIHSQKASTLMFFFIIAKYAPCTIHCTKLVTA